MNERDDRHPLGYHRPAPASGRDVPTPRAVTWLALLAVGGGAGGVWLSARIGFSGDVSSFASVAAMMLGGLSLTACAAGTATLFWLLLDSVASR